MKKAWRKLYRQELLSDFIMCQLPVVFGGGFLLYLIFKAADSPTLFSDNIRQIGLCAAAVLIVILFCGIYFYRTSTSYIRWYKRILDSIPMPVIVTDKDAKWQQINKAAYEIMSIGPDAKLDKLSSTHLIDKDLGVVEKSLIHGGLEYRIIGNKLLGSDKDSGYLIVFYKVCPAELHETRMGFINEINRLFEQLSTATDQFHDCANALASCTIHQAKIILELSDVIAEIASGAFKEDALKEKMYGVKADMEKSVEISQTSLHAAMQSIKELDDACACIKECSV